MEVFFLPDSIGHTSGSTLKARALELATSPTSLSHELRTELAALCWMFKHSGVALEHIQRLAAADCYLDARLQQPDHDSLTAPVYDVANRIWERLERMANGEAITLEDPPPRLDDSSETAQAYDAWLERRRTAVIDWWKTVTTDLDQVLKIFRLFHVDAIPMLPAEIRESIENAKLREVLDGPAAIGAAMYAFPGQPTGGITSGFGDKPMWAADALARAVRSMVASLEATVGRGDTKEAGILKSHLQLMLAQLKGYVHAGTQDKAPLVYMLPAHPAVVERIINALTGGEAALERHQNIVAVTDWRGTGSTDLARTINNMSAAELAQRLRDKIAAAVEEVSSER